MKHNVKLRSQSRKNIIGLILLKPLQLFRMVSSLFRRLSRREKFIFFVLISVLVVLFVFEGLKIYYTQTKIVPTNGGEYVELLSGEVKYLSPVLAKTDAEKAISRVIYSSLVSINEENQPQPDLALSWEVSPDGLKYTFHLRDNVVFHNGQTFESYDVASTIEAIQDESNKSPLRDIWVDVTTETPDPLTISFILPKQYGPFIYNCIFGVMDSDDISVSLSSNYNGSGPYKYTKTAPDEKNNYLEVLLEANSGYYITSPMISQARFIVTKNDLKDTKKIYNQEVFGSAGANFESEMFTDFSFTTGRRLVEFFNIRKEPLNNIELRKKIVKGENIDTELKLKIVSLDAEPQKGKANAISERLKAQNILVESNILSVNDYTKAIAEHDYDILVYGYNWSYDNDPYMFWHSSHLDKNNFSGYSSKEDDIFLEDTRMILDYDQRLARYEQFIQKMSDNALVIYFDNEKYQFSLSKAVKNIDIKKSYGKPEDRLNGIASWYIREKREKK